MWQTKATMKKNQLHKKNAQKGNAAIIFLCTINTFFTIGIGYFFYKSYKKEKSQEIFTDSAEATEDESKEKSEKHGEGNKEAKKESQEYGRIINLDAFTVNLSTVGPSTPKYLRINISLEVANPETESEVNTRLPLVRDAVIDLFNGKRNTDLLTPEQRDIVKEEIKNYINSKLINGKIKSVYFTNFAVTG
jgi:flagellar basal body-associated protein FliL